MTSKTIKIAVAALFALPLCGVGGNVFAQTEQKAMYESKSYDNWYIGVNGGVASKTTHNKWADNLNGNGGVRVGRWFTPAFGLMIEGNAYVGDKPQPNTGTFVKYVNTAVGTTINLSNWWFGYNGEPRFFEVIAVPAVGIGHVFGNESKVSHGLNDMTGKLAMDFAFNVDKKKSLQIYLEPALLYSIYGNANNDDQPFGMDINRSHFQVNIGVAYKFKNSNGSHNFKYAEPVVVNDEEELNRLNGRIAELQAENEELRNRPAPCVAPRIITKEIAGVEPVVVFAQGSSVIEKKQYANIERMAKYLKDNDKNVKITGYASTEGSKELNQKLSEARAEAVKHALIDKYGISPDNITISGEGATDTQSSERALNRVAVLTVLE